MSALFSWRAFCAAYEPLPSARSASVTTSETFWRANESQRFTSRGSVLSSVSASRSMGECSSEQLVATRRRLESSFSFAFSIMSSDWRKSFFQIFRPSTTPRLKEISLGKRAAMLPTCSGARTRSMCRISAPSPAASAALSARGPK